MRIAVIDIGTNSIHMLIAEILPNFTFEVIGREKEMTRLGDGTLSTGSLSNEVMKRGLVTLKKFKHLALTKGVPKIIAVATSAVREAQNGGDFLQKIFEETQIKVRIITGEEEGRLIYEGVKHTVELPKENTLIIDIGGGSVELIVANPDKILFLRSLKMGAARTKDLFLKKGSKKEFRRLEEYIANLLEEAAPEIIHLGFSHVIGTSGTINNLASMAFHAREPDAQNLPRTPDLRFEDLKELYRKLQDLSLEERLEMKGLDPLRHDLILSGAAVAYVLMKTLKVESLAFCDKAIREGMIYDYIAHHRRKIKNEMLVPDVRRRSILKLAHKCNYGKEHAEQTGRLALQIFDQTQSMHHLSPQDRELLEYASLLHDIGYYIGYEKHHRHAYYLIKNVTMNAFTEEEIDILALIARYHRRQTPKKTHSEFGFLPKMVRKRIEWLAALLKVADALDRSHFSVVQSIRVKTSRKSIRFVLTVNNDVEYEIWDAKHKCDLLERLSKREILFEAHPKKFYKPGPLQIAPSRLKVEDEKKLVRLA